MLVPNKFLTRRTVEQVEEGNELAPKFNEHGLIRVITTDFSTGEVLMHAFMNEEALSETIRTGEAVYWSRSRKTLWRKGATSGLVQKVRELRIDDDQDVVWLRVEVAGSGASCHVGYRSCFYRVVPTGPAAGQPLQFESLSLLLFPAITYKKQSPHTLRYLWLQLDPNIFRPDSDSVKTLTAPPISNKTSSKLRESYLHRMSFNGGVNITPSQK